MRLVLLDNCQSGYKLGQSIYNENGRVLLAKDTYLTDRLIERLRSLNVFTVYIDDELSEGISIVESIPVELRNEAVHVITEGLEAIAGSGAHSQKFERMMKTDRAIRSMQKVFKDIISCLKENQTALQLLASTLIHENHVYTHSLNVTLYSCQLAIENGLPLKNVEEIGLGAMLHDLGKLYIPPEILNKPGKLTITEFEQIKAHSELGFDILRKIPEIPLVVAHCAFQHHENIDGTGYPRGIKESEIHKYAKIISVADVFDAVTSHRVYRPAMLPHQGLEILYSGSGTKFDRKQVQMFKECIAIYPQGLTVKLNDGRTGIVSRYNFGAAGRPIVRIITDEENQNVKPYEIDLATDKHLTINIIEANGFGPCLVPSYE